MLYCCVLRACRRSRYGKASFGRLHRDPGWNEKSVGAKGTEHGSVGILLFLCFFTNNPCIKALSGMFTYVHLYRLFIFFRGKCIHIPYRRGVFGYI